MPTTPFRTGTVILGESAGTVAMLQPFQPGYFPGNAVHLPERVLAAVYYPIREDATPPAPSPNPLRVAKGPFPVLLYAHASRDDGLVQGFHPASRDFTSVEAMLRYVAACVCVAPDLNWLPDYADGAERAVVLANYYTSLHLSTPL